MTKEEYLKRFQSPFHQPDWELFLKELLPNAIIFPTVKELRSPNESVVQILEFGEYQTADRKKVKMYAVQLRNKKIARNRVGINKIIATELSPGIVDAALVVFHDLEQPEWRFSFLAKANTKGGEIETAFQRFTYVFGTEETHRTAISRMELLAASGKNLAEFKEAFNVEKLNNKFFIGYKERYQAFCNDLISKAHLHKSVFGIEYPEGAKKEEIEKLQKPLRDFVKLLMGRIMFIYFLQKKGWMGCPPLPDSTKLPCDESGEWKNGAPNFLQDLFEKNKDLQPEFYSKVLTELFFNTLNNPNRPGCLFPLTNTRVPYLNGGLFHDAHPHTNGVDFEPQLFKQLFTFLSEYNFTIYEDSPDDQEIGIDPEMLGRIFESLLEANKDFGTFYTPKPVVHYMCQESLLSYLKLHLLGDAQAVGNEAAALEELVRRHDRPEEKTKAEYIRLKAKEIESLLEKITVCDPAVGSGAFPMGMMQEMLYIRQALDWTLADPAAIKKSILQNNLYGVDLDGGAVEIARLRFWLSLVVDDESPKPLPNLDYKIMQGNSLLESFEGIPLSVEEEVEEDEAIIKNGQLDMFGNIKDGQLGIFASGAKVEKTISNEEVKKLKKLVDQFFSIGANAKSGKSVVLEKEETKAKIDGIIIEAIRRKIKKHKDLLEAEKKERMIQRGLLDGQLQQANLSPGIKRKAEKAKEKFEKDQEIWARKYNAELLKEKQLEDTLKIAEKPYFLWHLYFGSVFENGGFDLVIGNPPYGGTPITTGLQNELELGSADVYGAFISFGLHSAGKKETQKAKTPLLKPNGLLAFIVSDTFMTIKTHKPLRQQMMQHRLLKMVRMHPKTFKATVNTAIVLAQRNQPYTLDSKEKGGNSQLGRWCSLQMVDLTTVNPHDEYDLFRKVLSQTYQTGQVSNSRYAIYQYPQSLIATNSNLPFFVASPKLFALMNDQTAEEVEREMNGKQLKVRQIRLNEKEVEVVKLGEIAEAPHGISTGNNKKYVRVLRGTSGGHEVLEDWMIISKSEMMKISDLEKVKGLNKDWTKLEGCFVPFEKGGDSDSDDGWLPNYYVPTSYYINWGYGAIQDMKKNPGFAWKNEKFFFRDGLTFSISGVYAPTFRLNGGGVFEAKGSGLFSVVLEKEFLLAIMGSRLAKFILKTFVKHSVDTSGDDITSFRFSVGATLFKKDLCELVIQVIAKQKNIPKYDYASHEQIEIDRIVYEAYGLNEDDIREVECWYARRYPKLAEAQLRNLKALGKTQEYEYFKQYWQSDPMLQATAVELPEQKQRDAWLAEIAQGESKTLEFKSTLVWDVKEGKKSPVMEHAVLKTLAAFMNSEGGVLYIGITDAKEIFGLEADVKALGKGNVDGVLLHLDNLIKNSLGTANQQYLRHEVGQLEGKDVIRFEVKPASKEVWLTFGKKDSNGKQEEFYIRSQASSVALQGKELGEYLRGRF